MEAWKAPAVSLGQELGQVQWDRALPRTPPQRSTCLWSSGHLGPGKGQQQPGPAVLIPLTKAGAHKPLTNQGRAVPCASFCSADIKEVRLLKVRVTVHKACCSPRSHLVLLAAGRVDTMYQQGETGPGLLRTSGCWG